MSRDILTRCEGWTPVVDYLASELGTYTALVYGVVWRHCQMRSGVCYASMQTLADYLNISRRSVQRHVKKLCDAGYLEDTTPGVRNKPHTYRDTAKVELRGAITVVVGRCDSKSHQAEDGVSGSHTDSYDRESHKDTEYTNSNSIEEKTGDPSWLRSDGRWAHILNREVGK